ncbi:MAG: hypothetical protein WD768_03425 [Phycisphaeraceae bacterium]
MKRFVICAWMIIAALASAAHAAPGEDDYYKIVTLAVPKNIVLEVSGILSMKDGRLMVCTRRGEVYIVENAYADPGTVKFNRWTFGLAEPLGMYESDGWIYVAQRGELSRLKDSNSDDVADVFETVNDDWAISGNYHEYCFGPTPDKDGYLWVTLNKPFGGEPYGKAHWRGWAVRIDPKTGKMHPMANGLRSPAGVATSPAGDVFYTDNQGEWCNASKLSHLEFGDFHGHPHGLDSVNLPGNPIKGPQVKDVPSGTYMKDLKAKIPSFKMPAVWFPYEKMGKSPSGMAWDTSKGKFGPFDGQLFVGDQHHATVMRVFLEKIDGHWQGAAFPFRQDFQCGVIRVAFGTDASMFVGMSNRGWGGRGNAPYGLQRLVYTGKVPFEIHEMRAKVDGFELTFTQPVDKASAEDVNSYRGESYTYKLAANYGGPEDDKMKIAVTKATVSGDGKSVRLTIDPLRAGYVHELHLPGVKNAAGEGLLHPAAYYTLVNVPK